MTQRNPRREFFEDLAPRWDSMHGPEREAKLRVLIERFRKVWADARSILDLGTGTGALLPVIERAFPLVSLRAVDLAHAMLIRAHSRNGVAGLANADARWLPFAPTSFDVVICHATFPHFSDKPATLRELRRTLRPGGMLLILHDSSREQVNAIHRRAGGAIASDILPRAAETRALLAAAGQATLR